MTHPLLLREVFPSDLPSVCEYRREFLERGDSMDGTSHLRDYENMNEWLDFIRRASRKETCNPNWVPDTQYLVIRRADNRLVGMLDIRDELNKDCLLYYGHIGYSIRPAERRKGYAANALSLALDVCRKKGIGRALITCERENIASRKTILRCGGILENEIFDPNDGSMTQRYWISLNP